MKPAFLAISVSLAFAAAPAFADDTAVINQFGSGGNVMIEQVDTMGANHVSVTQNEGWGGHSVTVSQHRVADSSASVYQSGNNQVNVFQRDGANLNAEVNSHAQYGYDGYGGEYNFVAVDQIGYDAWARVDQAGSNSFNYATVMQVSQGGLMAEIFQNGNANQATIMQAGSNLSATIMQGGSNNTASIIQSSYPYLP